MTNLRIIDGTKPAPKPRTIVVCTCRVLSRTFVQAVTGLVRDDKGNVIKGPGAVKQWVCAHCGKPVA